MGSSPRFVDFDGDGILDLMSGSYDPGEVYLFRGEGQGRYRARETIRDKSGRPVTRIPGEERAVGSWPALVDWDGNGDLDLLIGGYDGALVVRINEGTRSEPAFAAENLPVLLESGKPACVPDGHASPVVVDWDGDGLWDIISGSANGGVYWFRNVGTPGAPRFAPAAALIPPHVGMGYSEFLDADEEPRPGIRSQVAVVDYDRDGRMDIVLGDFSTTVVAREDLTATERDRLAVVRRNLAESTTRVQNEYARIRLRLAEEFGSLGREELARQENQERWRSRIDHLRSEPEAEAVFQRHAECSEAQRAYLRKPQHPAPGDDMAAAHGYVWLFLRA